MRETITIWFCGALKNKNKKGRYQFINAAIYVTAIRQFVIIQVYHGNRLKENVQDKKLIKFILISRTGQRVCYVARLERNVNPGVSMLWNGS